MRTTDVQAILRLVGGAAELWYEPTLQRQFTLDSLCRLLSAKVGVCFAYGDVLLGGATPCTAVTTVGLDDAGQMLAEEYLRSGTPRDPVMEVLHAIPGRVITLCRRDAVADADWFKCDHYKKLRKPLGLGPTMYVKIVAGSIERETIVMLCREEGAEAFTERDAYLVDLCLSEMAWPFTPDMSYTDPTVENLQPRLKKVMKLLLEGDSEKQVAYKLGLSPHTVHEYVKNLYAELNVSSRGELLAQYVGKV
jgi:DNA-binding CsgD family transcriptional regulator